MNNLTEYFKEQVSGGAIDQFFYGVEDNGTVEIKRHRGTLDSLPTNLQYFRMVGSTPFFTVKATNE